MNYFEFSKRFPTEDSAIDYIVAVKYKDGYVCPKCGCIHKKIYRQNYDRRKLYCDNCKSEFSALKGTIFENTQGCLCIATEKRTWYGLISFRLENASADTQGDAEGRVQGYF